jgi:hypothetical protein
MKNILSSFIVFSLLLLGACESGTNEGSQKDANASDSQTQPEQLPASINDFLNQTYPGLDIRGWEFSEDEYEVIFLLDGYTYESAFDAEFNWFITERPIDEEEVPDVVRAAFSSSEFSTWEIIDIQLLAMPDNPELYLYELAGPEGEGEELFFDAQGTLIQAQKE